MNTEQLLSFEQSGSGRTAVFRHTLPPQASQPLTQLSNECLFYVLDGRGIISVYDPVPEGDLYELRQDISVFLTPKIPFEIANTGDAPLRFLTIEVTGGVAPEGEVLTWTAVSQRGVTVDAPAVGAGVAVTRVFDEGKNPSQMEGQHLAIRDVWLRRPQKFANAEVLTVAPGRATRLHTHHDMGETSIILAGEGAFVWDEKQIPCSAGDVLSYPIGVQRQVVNNGRFPLTYLLTAAFL